VRRPGRRQLDLVVVGAGAGGLSAARAGAQAGASCVLVSDGPPGGDCTFTGCVPSKCLLEAAAAGLGYAAASARMREVVDEVAAAENPGALAAEGIEVLAGRGRLVGPRTVEVAGRVVTARAVVIATGSAPAIPDLAGSADVTLLTNESIFALSERPSSLVVLGGGPVGVELAQAFARFGTAVHLVETAPRLLPSEEPEVSAVLEAVLAGEGITLHLGAGASAVRPGPAGTVVVVLDGGGRVETEALLVATGRRPVTDGLDPGAGGVELDAGGFVRTDGFLRTTAEGTYAVGDVTGRMPFTHAADEMGRIAVANALGRRRRRFDTSAVPWVIFTDPEVARVGCAETSAPRRSRVASVPMRTLDRARTAGRTEGFVTLVAAPRRVLGSVGGGRLVGATIVAPRAGEMIHEVALAVRSGMFTGRLAQTVHAYPTWSVALRQAAASFFVEVDGRRARPAHRAAGSPPASRQLSRTGEDPSRPGG